MNFLLNATVKHAPEIIFCSPGHTFKGKNCKLKEDFQ